MPYIKFSDRDKFVSVLIILDKIEIRNGGELNYILSKIALMYLKQHKESYQTWSDIHSALTLSDAELRQRFLNLYEAKKIVDNGDII